jgi:hypothetical protein
LKIFFIDQKNWQKIFFTNCIELMKKNILETEIKSPIKSPTFGIELKKDLQKKRKIELESSNINSPKIIQSLNSLLRVQKKRKILNIYDTITPDGISMFEKNTEKEITVTIVNIKRCK